METTHKFPVANVCTQRSSHVVCSKCVAEEGWQVRKATPGSVTIDMQAMHGYPVLATVYDEMTSQPRDFSMSE